MEEKGSNLIRMMEQLVEYGGGDTESYRTLGVYFEKVSPNPFKAVTYYTKASMLGDRHSQWNLGSMFYRGAGVKKNVKKGVQLLEKSAKLIDPDLTAEENEFRNSTADSVKQRIQALVELWNIYSSNDVNGIEKDFEKALKYLEDAAGSENQFKKHEVKNGPNLSQTILNAQELLVHIYEMGVLGVSQDKIKSQYWLKKAQRNGHSKASSIAALATIQTKVEENSKKLISVCIFCSKESPQLLKCSRCHTELYCTKVCRKRDWSNHKKLCNCKDASMPIITKITKDADSVEKFQSFLWSISKVTLGVFVILFCGHGLFPSFISNIF